MLPVSRGDDAPSPAAPAAPLAPAIAGLLDRLPALSRALRLARAPSLARALRLALALALLLPAASHLARLGYVFAKRLAFPADLEWMEGAILYQAERVRLGQPVFAADGSDFVPLPYPPLYHTLVALLSPLGGVRHALGRGLSLAAFAAIVIVAARELIAHARERRHGVAAAVMVAAAFAAAYPLVGGWYDLCRVDTLALALPIVAAALARPERAGPARVIGVAALLVAGAFTKQTSQLFAAWIVLWWIAQRPRSGLALGALTAALAGGVLGALQLATHGRYLHWTVELPLRLGSDPSRARAGLKLVLAFAPYAYPLAPVALALAAQRALGARAWLWIGLAVAAVPASLAPYQAPGGYVNLFMPMVILFPIAAGMIVLELIKRASVAPDVDAARSPAVARALAWGALATAAAYLHQRAWEPAQFLPTPEHRIAAERLERLARELPGGLFVPTSPIVGARGRPRTPQVHTWAVHDALETQAAPFDWPRYFARLEARWVLVCAAPPGLDAHYRLDRVEPIGTTIVTGLQVRCEQLWRRRDDAPPSARR